MGPLQNIPMPGLEGAHTERMTSKPFGTLDFLKKLLLLKKAFEPLEGPQFNNADNGERFHNQTEALES